MTKEVDGAVPSRHQIHPQQQVLEARVGAKRLKMRIQLDTSDF